MSRLLLDYSPQIFFTPTNSIEHNIKASPSATGVLVNILGHPFLFTAKHVFNIGHVNDFSILTDKMQIPLCGDVAFYQLPKHHDTVDVAIIKLPPQTAKAISSTYKFLPWTAVDFQHKFDQSSRYCFLGFINEQTILNGEEFECHPFSFETTLKTGTRPENHGYVSHENLLMKYERGNQRIDSELNKVIGPQTVTGLSGCGIWHVRRNEQKGTKEHSLVGIMIEQRMNKGFLVGTKTQVILKLLEERFNINLPVGIFS